MSTYRVDVVRTGINNIKTTIVRTSPLLGAARENLDEVIYETWGKEVPFEDVISKIQKYEREIGYSYDVEFGSETFDLSGEQEDSPAESVDFDIVNDVTEVVKAAAEVLIIKTVGNLLFGGFKDSK